MIGLPWMFGGSGYYGNMMRNDWWWGGGFAWFIPLAVWSIFWTGLALWHAAKRGEKWWFIFFLLVHTAGIIEILYILFVARANPLSRPSSGKHKHKGR